MEDNKSHEEETSQKQEELESENEEFEETDVEEYEDDSEDYSDDDSENDSEEELSIEDYKKLEKKNKQLYARLKKLEETKVSKKKQVNKSNNNDFVTREEAEMMSKGYDMEDIRQLKRLAGNDSLSEAVNDTLFKSYYKDKQEKKKSEAASLGASNKSGIKYKKPIDKMSREEHMKYWKDNS